MGISPVNYDPSSRKWDITYEKTDNKTDLPVVNTVSRNVKVITKKEFVQGAGYKVTGTKNVPITIPINANLEEIKSALKKAGVEEVPYYISGMGLEHELQGLQAEQESTQKTNIYNADLNETNLKTNTENQAKNAAYDKTRDVATTAKGGDYVDQRKIIRSLEGIDDKLKNTLEDTFKAYYLEDKEKFQTWDADKLGAKPAYGDFDVSYYLKQNPDLKVQWEEYKANDDVDVVNRYGEYGYYLQHYTTQGKPAGLRGNAAQLTEKANEYLEKKITDSDAQLIRDLKLGIDNDKTALDDAVNTAVGEQGIKDVKKFGALAQNVLKDTIDEMKKARSKEAMTAYIGEMDGMKEILNFGKNLSTEIMGDIGTGGVFAYNDKSKNNQESLEKSLQGLTGVNNLTTYNWQQWFDTTLKDKYSKDLEVGYTTKEASENVKIDGEFAKSFIEQYLNPRFNQSKDMGEFVDYLDVQSKEQNPFQTQDLLDATRTTAQLKADLYLKEVQKKDDRAFDSAFYFNPTGDENRKQAYADQAENINADWEAAKKGDDEYWANQAYRFGVDVTDKDAFARMHYETKGRFNKYDAAEDILNQGKVTDEIYNKILPALNKKVLTEGSVFGKFITPEAFSDIATKGLDPNNSAQWEEVLKLNGLTGFKGTLDELKTELSNSIRGFSAEDIRTRIAKLNKEGERPTQEKLGITYIQRDSDYTNTSKAADTKLYKTFKEAGYKGTEDEFYTDVFTDADREEQSFLTKAGTSSGLQLSDSLNSKDPFEAFSSFSKFLGEDNEDTPFTTSSGTTKKTTGSSYFGLDLGLDETDDTKITKSKSGQEFLSGFTSLFK